MSEQSSTFLLSVMKAHLTPAQQRDLARGLRLLGVKSYKQYLASPHWRAVRRKWRKKACEYCGAKRGLCLHHRSYANLGAELRGDLQTLCDTCHRAEHGLKARPKRVRKRKRRKA